MKIKLSDFVRKNGGVSTEIGQKNAYKVRYQNQPSEIKNILNF